MTDSVPDVLYLVNPLTDSLYMLSLHAQAKDSPYNHTKSRLLKTF